MLSAQGRGAEWKQQYPAAAAEAAWGQKSGRAVRHKRKPRKGHKRNMWGIFCLDIHCGIQQHPFWEGINPSVDCDRGFEILFPLNKLLILYMKMSQTCLPCLGDNCWCTVLGHSKGLAFERRTCQMGDELQQRLGLLKPQSIQRFSMSSACLSSRFDTHPQLYVPCWFHFAKDWNFGMAKLLVRY